VLCYHALVVLVCYFRPSCPSCASCPSFCSVSLLLAAHRDMESVLVVVSGQRAPAQIVAGNRVEVQIGATVALLVER